LKRTTAWLLSAGIPPARAERLLFDNGRFGNGVPRNNQRMLVSLIGRENVAEVYDPSRIATQSIIEAVPEIISSTVPYVDWITGGDVSRR